jgi:hypothetical protein
MPAKTRAFLDALAEKFSGPECQAVEKQLARVQAAHPDA